MSADVEIKRMGQLRSLRSEHEDQWRRCFEVSFPLRGDGFSGERVTADLARSRLAERRDSTATDSGRQLAAALMSGLTPANSRWFGLDVGNETDEERRWLDESAQVLWENIHAGNYDAAGFEVMLDAVAAGWLVMFVEEAEGGGYAFEPWPIAQCFVASTRRDGRVDTIYRVYRQTAAQLVARYGEANVSMQTRDLAAQKPDELIDVLLAVKPRKGEAGVMARNMPFSSCHYEVKNKHLLLESGYHEFPCVVPRWNMIPGTCYAVGPMFDALPDVDQLNRLVAMEDMAAELAVAGMWIAEDDGVLNPRTVKVGPRKVVVANSVDSMKPLLTGADFNVAFTKKDMLQAQIKRTLMSDQLQPQDGPAMTATEVHARMALVRQLLGPVYGRMQSEFLQPLIERTFGIAYRAGVFTPPPESLAGRTFTVKYLSPMARAQKLEDVTGMDRFEATLMAEAAAKPDIGDIYDWDNAGRHKAELLGVPPKFIRDARTVATLRDERAKATQDQQSQALAANGQIEMQGALAKRVATA